MTKRINATVSDELYQFTESINRGNKSYVVKLGLECLRLFGSLEMAKEAFRVLAATKVVDELRTVHFVAVQANPRGVFVSIDTNDGSEILDAVKTDDLIDGLLLLAERG